MSMVRWKDHPQRVNACMIVNKFENSKRAILICMKKIAEEKTIHQHLIKLAKEDKEMW